jgi:hypothetical protein
MSENCLPAHEVYSVGDTGVFITNALVAYREKLAEKVRGLEKSEWTEPFVEQRNVGTYIKLAEVLALIEGVSE